MNPVRLWTFLLVGLSFALYLAIAWISRVRDTKGFYVAGQGVPAAANGMATAADWMSAASFISMAGIISTLGYAGGVYLMGWTGGYVLLALMLAPYLRKFGRYTVPDFIGDRYNSSTARIVAVVCAIFVSFTYVAGQMRGVGVVFSRFLEVDVSVGVYIGMTIVLVYAILGGMKGITWTQVAQYWVLITAFLIPAIAISIQLTGNPIPQLGLGSELLDTNNNPSGISLLERLNQLHDELGFASYTQPFVEGSPWNMLNVACVTLALMCGTAGLPHVIVRFYTVKNVAAARWSGFYALFFIALLYLTAPAVASFARYYMIESINGRQAVADTATHATDHDNLYQQGIDRITTDNGRTIYLHRNAAAGTTVASEIPHWFRNWQRTGLILWLDDGDGKVRYSNTDDNEIFRRGSLSENDLTDIRLAHQQWLDTQGAAGTDGRTQLHQRGLSGPDRDIIVLATPEMAELADWIIALIAAGGLAAALSTASGLLLVISSSVAHDLYYRILNPEASEKQRLLVGRVTIALAVAVAVAGYFGIYPPGFVSEVVAFAFGLAAASFFPALVLGIFNLRVGAIPAITGMVAGIGFTALYILGNKAHIILGPELADALLGTDSPLRTPWLWNINPQGIGVVGMIINFAVTLILTPLTPGPDDQTREMIAELREPEHAGPAVQIEAAQDH
ncbi:sodium:solute symporter family protein [Mucisphaera calidilacus]|uniref:Cation/acetate symporter ActP n=1 Tax=Mucisphaera calidilacus TaxID=2527982 RepID=A0A518BVU9_9BACT|nr:sodium:solute symporter family protein [Mucisphaera calidilacus]QDU71105.1 Cation/acetate symporter ActP [Mucisphaera calidilacus]